MASDMDVSQYTSDQLVQFARVAEAAERYPDMCEFMKELVTKKVEEDKELEVDERNLLSVAYKNVVGSKRSSWRTLSSGSFDQCDADLIKKYKKEVEEELKKLCLEVITLLKDKLLPKADGKKDETEVFYKKMCGDYYRYLSEFITDEAESKENKNNCNDYYNKAMECAKSNLAETHPTRLGLALNYSVCYYEIMKKPDEACKLAKEAFDAAIEKLDTLNDASYKDSTLIMQLLRDNLTLWTSESSNAEEEAAS